MKIHIKDFQLLFILLKEYKTLSSKDSSNNSKSKAKKEKWISNSRIYGSLNQESLRIEAEELLFVLLLTKSKID